MDKKRQQQIRAGAGGKPDPALVHERVAALRACKWSSYRAYAGLTAIPRWLETRSILQLGGGRKDECRRNYRRYVEQAVREGLEASPWEQVKEQVILGGQEFLAGLREQLKGDDREQRALKRLRDGRPPIEKVIRCVYWRQNVIMNAVDTSSPGINVGRAAYCPARLSRPHPNLPSPPARLVDCVNSGLLLGLK